MDWSLPLRLCLRICESREDIFAQRRRVRHQHHLDPCLPLRSSRSRFAHSYFLIHGPDIAQSQSTTCLSRQCVVPPRYPSIHTRPPSQWTLLSPRNALASGLRHPSGTSPLPGPPTARETEGSLPPQSRAPAMVPEYTLPGIAPFGIILSRFVPSIISSLTHPVCTGRLTLTYVVYW